MAGAPQELATLRFVGPRFEDHGLSFDVAPELAAYKCIVVEFAKETWRRRNPTRERVPSGFESAVDFKFFTLLDGSVGVPVMKVATPEPGKLPLVSDDDFDDAADLFDEAILAASEDRALPDGVTRELLGFCGKFGTTLRPEERIEIKSRRRQCVVRYTPAVRERLVSLSGGTHEDEVDLFGEVRAADLDGRSFRVHLDNGDKVRGEFAPEQEPIVTDALREHASRRLRIRGRGVFADADGALQRIVRVSEVLAVDPGPQQFDPTARPIWEIAVEIGDSVPAEEWDKIPSDLAANLDHYLYGTPKKTQ